MSLRVPHVQPASASYVRWPQPPRVTMRPHDHRSRDRSSRMLFAFDSFVCRNVDALAGGGTFLNDLHWLLRSLVPRARRATASSIISYFNFIWRISHGWMNEAPGICSLFIVVFVRGGSLHRHMSIVSETSTNAPSASPGSKAIGSEGVTNQNPWMQQGRRPSAGDCNPSATANPSNSQH